jgi:Beta-lactamase
MSYRDYLRGAIFDPLGMRHSHADPVAVGSDHLADGHRFWFGFPRASEPTRRNATLAAGYLVSTAADLGRYLSMYLSGGVGPDGTRIVSARGVQTLLGAGPQAQLGEWAEGQQSRYAMGWFVGGPWGEGSTFHPGNTPDTTAMLTLFPDRGMAVAVLVGAGNELPIPGNPFIADRIARNAVHAALGQTVLELPSIQRFYLAFDAIALVVLAAAVWGLLRATATALAPPPPPSHPARRWAAVLLRAAAAGAVFLFPWLTYGWGGLWTWAPDLAAVLASLVLLLAVTAAIRAGGLLRRHRLGARQPTAA